MESVKYREKYINKHLQGVPDELNEEMIEAIKDTFGYALAELKDAVMDCWKVIKGRFK